MIDKKTTNVIKIQHNSNIKINKFNEYQTFVKIKIRY